MGSIDTIQEGSIPVAGSSESRRSFFPYWGFAVVSAFFVWLQGRLAKRRSRIDLLSLTDEQLKDIGISRADAYREGLRPFWD